MVTFTKHDLQFILDGILVSEAHAAATNTVVANVWTVEDIEVSRQILLSLIPNSLEPIGMRTITGELNNLVIDQEYFGSLGEFPRALEPDYRDDSATGNTEIPFGFGPFGPFLTNTDYANSDSNFNGSTGPISNGDVIDSDPRIISNLISDQTDNNPVAEYIAGQVDGSLTDVDGDGLFFIPNTAPDEGLSAPFNSWMTLFGQFFDHGLDLVGKGGSGTVFIPLQPDDPLYNPAPGAPNFMVVTRATVDPGPDGILGTEDDVADAANLTSPFVDQNQTYTSHPSHQIFVREYALVDIGEGLRPYATGRLIEGANGGMATWGEVKAQAASVLGIELTDVEAINIPEFAVDQYGEFIRGANGLPQYVMADGTLVEGDLNNPVSVAEAEAIAGTSIATRTGFSFLLDINREADPVNSQTGMFKTADDDTDVGLNHSVTGVDVYDNELLDAHYIAGDGRANENFGLTAVHHVFHGEHNRLVEATKEVLLSSINNIDLGTVGDLTGDQAALDLLNGYLLQPVAALPTTQLEIDALIWDGDRLFQAAKFGTEMQYQHLVFEEFARKVQPLVDLFASYETSIDAAIVAEFAHTVYRFGHSMLTETVDLMDAEGNLTEIGLIEAFLNPFGFNQNVQADGTVSAADILTQDSSAAAAAVVRGMTRQVGNEIDEFITEALRNNLLGLPLDLGAINIARGRETGIPTLNDARAQFFAGTGDTKLKPYDSWVDFALNLKHGGASIVNFIAAYGQHDLIRNATTVEQKRAAALTITTGVDQSGTDSLGNNYNFVAATDAADRLDFLNGTGSWAGIETGLNLVDFWIGGLAEAIEPFGGMLGSTFNFVFEQQLEDLQDGDRFYYLGRVAGLNFLSQLEQNSLANMIIRNTEIGDNGGDHLPGDIFSTPAYILEVDQSKQITGLGEDLPDIPVIQSGTVLNVTQADAASWTSVTFPEVMPDAVVAVMLNTINGGQPTTVRVRNVTETGFEFQLDEYDYLDGAHIAENISWVAVREGETTLSDGTVIKAGYAQTGSNTPVNFEGEAFTGAPVVFTQLSSVNEETAAATRIDDLTAGGFTLSLREQEAGSNPGAPGTQGSNSGDPAHLAESIGWIAIQQGDGTLLQTGTVNNVTHNNSNIAHNGGFAAPVFLAEMQTLNGGDTSTVRGVSFDANNATFFIEEEQSNDTETNHTTETVGYLTLASGVILGPDPLKGRLDPTNDPANPGVVNPFLDLGDDNNALVIRGDLDNDGDNDLLHYTGGDHVVLGGTEENDTLIGGIGDDTLWGDGGDDNLEGGDGGDIILGGDGDDVITDIGGINNLQGQDGNDAISAGGGESLILAGAGKDFVLHGPDFAETFGGLGDDFINAGTESNIVFGNEGNDWLEGGGGNNLLQGDNGDPFLNSSVGGHDVFISGLGDDDYHAEGGDDIMEGADGVQRFEGLNGFDWATYKDVDQGVSADFFLRAFDETPLPPSNVSIQDRFDSVEGLSGGRGNDILRGGDTDLAVNSALNNGNDNILRNFDLIQGLRAGDFGGLFDSTALFTQGTLEWGEGDIILGGAGSDLIEGRGGNDIIEGDLKLDVRMLIRDADTNAPIATAYKMQGLLYAVDANGTPLRTAEGALIPMPLGDNGEYASLHEAVFARAVNPGNIHILREIIDESNATDFDAAQFSDLRANYTIETTDGTTIGDLDGDGYITVSHNIAGGDGIDKLRGIERLIFADQTINLTAGNTLATGAPVILDAGTNLPVVSPFLGQQLRAAPGSIADEDGISNAIFSYIWQVEQTAGAGDFIDIAIINAAGEDGPLTGPVITISPELVGFALRVRASFQDDAGVVETLFSAPTQLVAADVVAGPTNGDDILVGTILGDLIQGLGGDDLITALDGNDILIGGALPVGTTPGNNAGNDILDGGLGIDTAVLFGAFEDFLFEINPEGILEAVEITSGEEDALIDIEIIEFRDPVTGAITDTRLVSDILDGETIIGTNGIDALVGTAFNDIILGLDGDDEIEGAGGLDIIDAGAGDDVISWRAGDGSDIINGGTNTLVGDSFDIRGQGGIAEVFRIYAVNGINVTTQPVIDLIANFGAFFPGTEVIITVDDGTGETLVAQLNNIEEIVIENTAVGPADGVADGDTFEIIGDFNTTSLFQNTITINGTAANDVIDISALDSSHRVVIRSNGGQDTIVGALRPQDVIELAPGTGPADYAAPVYDPSTGTWTVSQINGPHSITYSGAPDMTHPALQGLNSTRGHNIQYSASDITELLNLVNGRPSENLDEDTAHATGIRDLEGTGNNVANPNFGSADQPFIRLTEARYGEFDPTTGNYNVNPIFAGLDARTISNILGDQEEGLAKSEAGTSILFMAFGQYFDHGLDFLPKGGNGILTIGTDPSDDPADLTRGTVFDIVDGVPQHLNQASPFVDQNQAYGSNELVGQFLRESVKADPSDPHGVAGARLFAGAPDPSNPEFNLLPTMRELISHHWENDTMFYHESLPGGQLSFRDYFTDFEFEDLTNPGTILSGTLVDGAGLINEAMISAFNSNFMGSGYTLVGDANPFINLLDHYVAGDLRANENYTLTSIHTIWARNHNYHVEGLREAGFTGTEEELFQAAKIINEVEYQRVVFDEFADALLGGLKGSGSHGFDEYNPNVDARISHEFAAAAYRFGHSLISETITVLGPDGQPMDVRLFDAFLNPTNDEEAFTLPFSQLANFGYIPQEGFEQIGVDPILGGIATQQSEEVDFNIVNAVRNDLVRIRADLFAFNVTRGWDVGLGTLNQIRADLLASDDPYIKEAIDRSGEDFTPYTSWEDFQLRNDLSNTVIAQFKEAYPDLELSSQAEIDAFKAANPNIQLTGANNNIVKGIDRVDLWVGGLAEEHINGGVVGTTFWVILHEQLDRLQEGDRFYYLDRAKDFDFYDFTEEQSFGDIIARNSGLNTIQDDVFYFSENSPINGDPVPDNNDAENPDNPIVPSSFTYTAEDITELLNLVNGRPSENLDEDTAHATGIRDLEGTGNNVANPNFGSSDQPFIRLTEARYGEFDPTTGNFNVNPIFAGLDARNISNILGDQEEGLAKAEAGTSIFFMAFGQYFDHGLDFLPKGGNGILTIGTDPSDDPADLTRGSVFDIVDGVPQHLNQASPFVDQNQAYGSNELVGQFLRESVKDDPSDPNGVAGARLFAGAPDPSNPEFNLLPTMRELISHHWENDTMFYHESLPGGQMSFRDYFTDLPYEDSNQPGVPLIGTLVDEFGVINQAMIPTFNGNFMNSGYTLVGDANPFINLLDHYVAGDLRANENYTLTSIHTVWARNHNFHVEGLLNAGFTGTNEELFQAAKILNEVEYQRVVFDEFADALLGGLKGSGEHGFDDYNPNVDARISHEFAAAAYRFGHSLISETITVLGPDGQPMDVRLFDAFLNPTNDNEALTLPLETLASFGYIPQDGYEQIGVNPIIGGIVNQQSEEVDFNIVDAVRNDLVRIRADLFAFNVTRGWDVGLGTLNQIRADLLASDDPYIKEAIDRSGEDFTPYTSWEDFKNRNGLSSTVIAQFMAAYPDLELASQAEIDAFKAANPNIQLTGANNNIVKGIDRVDLWVGGLAEEHINGGVVGTTFWVILHEQLDRLQEGDRFYYLDRAKDFDFYDQIEDQTFADIVARNTGLEGLAEDIFFVSETEAESDSDNETDSDSDTDTDTDTTDTPDTTTNPVTDPPVLDQTNISDAPMNLIGTELSDTLLGQNGGDYIIGLDSDDTLIGGRGNDTIAGGEGDDQILGGDDDDILLGDAGDDLIIAGAGDDVAIGGSGEDHILGDAGDDLITPGADRDIVDAGSGNDTVFAQQGDGDDVLNGGADNDTYDMSAITADITVNLGAGGMASSAQSGIDTLTSFENVITGAGDDSITASNEVNILTGGIGDDNFIFTSTSAAHLDHITDFQLGDKIDLTAIEALHNFAGDGKFDLLASGSTFTQAGQLIVTNDGGDLIVEGNVNADPNSDFSIRISGKSSLDDNDFA